MKRHHHLMQIRSLLMGLALLSLVVSGCGSKPSQAEVTPLVSQHHDTTHAEKWSLIKVTSVEIGKAAKNSGIIAQEPNDTMVYPVTVLLNECNRGWRSRDVQIANVRDEYVFAKNSTGKWVSYKVRSEMVGQSRASEEKWMPSSDAFGFNKSHIEFLELISRLQAREDAKDLLAFRQHLVAYVQDLTDDKGMDEVCKVKMIAEVLEHFGVKVANSGQAYQAGDERGPQSAERKQWAADLVSLGEFLKNAGFQGTTKLWEQFKAKR